MGIITNGKRIKKNTSFILLIDSSRMGISEIISFLGQLVQYLEK